MYSRCSAAVALTLWCALANTAAACPFCEASSPTICEELANAERIVVGRLISIDRAKKARYEIVDVLRGGSALSAVRHIEIADAADEQPGTLRLLTGCGAPQITWSQLHRLTPHAREYVRHALGQPAEGAERLAYFHKYLDDAEELIAQDAYNEFANAPYAEVRKLRDRMDRHHLVARLQNPKTPAKRRGLLITMLGICGTADELPFLEDLLSRGSKGNSGTFDALLAAQITLDEAHAIDTIDARFLRNSESDPADCHAAIRALRFHLEEQRGVSKERILQSLRLLLDRPELASVVIGDLARWEDWQAMPRLVELFKQSKPEATGLRDQVVSYLLACSLPEAKRHLADLERLAPKDVERARILAVYGRGASGPPVAQE